MERDRAATTFVTGAAGFIGSELVKVDLGRSSGRRAESDDAGCETHQARRCRARPRRLARAGRVAGRGRGRLGLSPSRFPRAHTHVDGCAPAGRCRNRRHAANRVRRRCELVLRDGRASHHGGRRPRSLRPRATLPAGAQSSRRIVAGPPIAMLFRMRLRQRLVFITRIVELIAGRRVAVGAAGPWCRPFTSTIGGACASRRWRAWQPVFLSTTIRFSRTSSRTFVCPVNDHAPRGRQRGRW